MVDNSAWTVQERIKYLQGCSPAQWDEICKGCGICCLIKYGKLSGETRYTTIACSDLDLKTRKCRIYNNRLKKNGCHKVDLDMVLDGKNIPASCGYSEFIFGPAEYPASVDFGTVIPTKNIVENNIFKMIKRRIPGSTKWNTR